MKIIFNQNSPIRNLLRQDPQTSGKVTSERMAIELYIAMEGLFDQGNNQGRNATIAIQPSIAAKCLTEMRTKTEAYRQWIADIAQEISKDPQQCAEKGYDEPRGGPTQRIYEQTFDIPAEHKPQATSAGERQ